MTHTRITLEVDINLDAFHADFHTPEQAEREIFRILKQRLPYNVPEVRIQRVPPVPASPEFLDKNQRINDYALRLAKEMSPDGTDIPQLRLNARKIADGIRLGF